MSGCVLKASKADFLARDFVALHKIPCERVWEDAFNTSVSDCDGDDLAGQVADAVTFLNTNAEMLPALTALQVDVALDFGLWRAETFTQSVTFPAALVQMAGSLGVELGISLYPLDP